MSDLIGIASNAVGAYQRALGTVSNNIANVNTEGYSRQDVVLKDTSPSKAANMFFGTGVALQAVKRQFDAFAESNLRNSTSDLASQKPMVDYTKRVMDIMGDKSVGLSSALDDFFGAANALSADPASSVLRSSFLRSSEGVSSRFAELSGQLGLVGTETNQALESTTKQVNTLTSQLALVNQNMASSSTEDGQSAEILDRRDLILRQLSDLVRIKTSFSTNGSVNVALGSTATQGIVVSGMKSRPIGIDTSVAGKMELLLDPYGNSESLASASGGQLGGLQTFINQVLEPAQKSLNFLAKTLVNETNQIQTNGIDGYGQTGNPLFSLDTTVTNEASGIRVALNDAMRVATAAQFRVTEDQTNSSNTRASVVFTPSPVPLAISNTNLVNNPNPTAGVSIKVEGARVMAPVTTLAAGVKATFYLDEAKPGQQLQVLTRDGRQLLGQTLSETEKAQILKTENGFVPDSNYSNAYLNKSNKDGYRGMDVFYGAMAKVRYAQVFDRNGVAAPPVPKTAQLVTSRITDNEAGIQIQAGATVLNGVTMPALETQFSKSLSPADVAAWINGNSLIKISQPAFNEFSIKVGGVPMTISALDDTQGLSKLAQDLQSKLRLADLTNNLSVNVASNGIDLEVHDALGRSISDVVLTPSTRPGEFSINVGGVALNVTPINDSNGLAALALDIQTKLRFADSDSTNLSVVVASNGVDLEVSDALSRSISNQVLLPSMRYESGGDITVSNSLTSQTGVKATIFNDIRVPAQQLDFKRPLKINGHTVAPGFKDVTSLVAAINSTANIGVVASVQQGDLVISAIPIGQPININPTPTVQGDGNALGITPTTYNGQVRMDQVVRDLHIYSTNIDYNKKLEINGATIDMSGKPQRTVSTGYASSSETLNAGDPFSLSLSVDGGLSTSIPISSDNATPLGVVNAINASKLPVKAQLVRTIVAAVPSTASFESPSFGATPSISDFTEFAINLDESTINLSNLNLQSADLNGLASALQIKLRAADGNTQNLTVSVINGSELKITDALGRTITNPELTADAANGANYGAAPVISDGTPVTNAYEIVLTGASGASGAFTMSSPIDGLSFTTNTQIASDASLIPTLEGLVEQINSTRKTIIDQQDPTCTIDVGIGVKASIGLYGDLVLSTLDPNGTDPISIGPANKANGIIEQNALGLDPIDYTLEERLKLQLAEDPVKSSIRFSFGTYGDPARTGSPSDLAKAGLRTGAYIEGGSVDDLLVFVTGQGKTSVAASYSGEPLNVRDSLRNQSLVVKFTAVNRYTIVDAKTGTQLADRHYDPEVLEPLIDFEGLQIKLSHAPNVGDSFQVDGNHDGLGNNINMLDMVDLSKKPVIAGKSLANTYIDQINNVGNLAQQATITQQALTVVYDQSVSARDKVSGVNLDEEAAALIRYQQAYQASAKALQISGTLFDAIVQIR